MNDKFTYTYTAPDENERREIEDIKQRYQTNDRNEKLARLKKLDAEVKNAPTVTGLVLGVPGTLIFGLGLTMILEWNLIIGGIVVMLAGCVPIALAYPAYNYVLKRKKARHSDEILKLADELLNEAQTND